MKVVLIGPGSRALMIHDDSAPLLAPLYAEGFGLTSTHLSERVPTRVCLIVRDGHEPVVELRRLDPGSTPGDLLERIRDETDEARLGDAVDDLVTEIDRSGSSLLLASWLGATGRSWAAERRAALAVALEVAARLDVRDTDLVIADVLADRNAHILVCRVAAQRARHVQFRDRETRCAAWGGLRRWLDVWLEQDVHVAAPAIPSAVLGEREGVAWLLDVVDQGPAEAAEAATLGLLDLISGATRVRVVVADVERDRVFHAARKRRSEPGTTAALSASLVWLLGAFATQTTLPGAIDEIHRTFVHGSGDEPAVAVAAARLLMQGPLSAPASRQLALAMAQESENLQRFWALVHRPRPQWRT